MPGTIHLKPVEANFDTETSKITAIHPVYVVTLGDQKVEGEMNENKAIHTQWAESVTLQKTSESVCLVELKDKDSHETDQCYWIIPNGPEAIRVKREILKVVQNPEQRPSQSERS